MRANQTAVNRRVKREDLTRFAGRWVAFAGEKVVESAPSLSVLMLKLKQRKPVGKPSVMLVPRKDEGPYILFL
ncbi:MAG: hypothetical protein HY470_00655 [Candidatus Ryanbacteria bacterium]|nr:hypothetical protein [Candidatus Ryanbacteria bacterium]